MKKILFLILFSVSSLFFVSCSKEDPRAIITVIDDNNRPVPNAEVKLFSKPTDLILEDIQFTDNEGKSYHEFVFEGTLDVKVKVSNYSIYNDLSGEGEVILTRGETYETTITLHEPIPPEED